MTNLRKTLLVLSVLLASIACDQVTKIAARSYLAPSPTQSFVGDMFRLQYSENTGAFLGMGASLPIEVRFWIFTLIIGVVLIGVLVLLFARRNLDTAYVIGVALLASGGIGNLIDRAFRNGAVTDFMNMGIGGLRTGIFNVADVAIMIGAGIIVYASYRRPSDVGSGELS
jgi:signal peptidase II